MSKQRCSAQGLGCASTNFKNKACRPVPTICIYGKQEPCGPLFTRKCRFAHVRQPNSLECCSNFSVFGRVFLYFIRYLVWIWCVVFFFGAGTCASTRDCACIRTYLVLWNNTRSTKTMAGWGLLCSMHQIENINSESYMTNTQKKISGLVVYNYDSFIACIKVLSYLPEVFGYSENILFEIHKAAIRL